MIFVLHGMKQHIEIREKMLFKKKKKKKEAKKQFMFP